MSASLGGEGTAMLQRVGKKRFGIPIRALDHPCGPFDSVSSQRDNSVGRDTVSRQVASTVWQHK